MPRPCHCLERARAPPDLDRAHRARLKLPNSPLATKCADLACRWRIPKCAAKRARSTPVPPIQPSPHLRTGFTQRSAERAGRQTLDRARDSKSLSFVGPSVMRRSERDTTLDGAPASDTT
jgi:hypothetical protein